MTSNIIVTLEFTGAKHLMLYLSKIIGIIFDGLDLVSKEIIENNFNDKKEIKANI